MAKHVAPQPDLNSFTCPHCDVLTSQYGSQAYYHAGNGFTAIDAAMLRRCFACHGWSIWIDGKLIFPESSGFPLPHDDMPDVIKAEYLEASSIGTRSPRGAAALLRLAIQKLCSHLGFERRNIDESIAAMVSAGLSPTIAKALDVVRVVGNNAVHPGEIELTDDLGTVVALAGLVNVIVEDRISTPKHIEAMFASLPEGSRIAIEHRNAKALPPTGP